MSTVTKKMRRCAAFCFDSAERFKKYNSSHEILSVMLYENILGNVNVNNYQ